MTAPNDHIDGVPVTDLLARFGSPLFVYSERAIRDACRRAKVAFQERYPQVQFAWSYKTCYLRAICASFHQEGWQAEVVSDFEYVKARHAGVPGDAIVFNGPWKSPAILKRAIAEGATIQVDHFDELATLSEIAQPATIGLRVRMETGVRPYWTKFGFDMDAGEAFEAVRRIAQNGNLNLVGLHTHLGARIGNPTYYRIATEKLIALALDIQKRFGITIRSLNLGGGFVSSTPWDTYAEAIVGAIRKQWLLDLPLPTLVLESGRALIEDAGYHVTTVVGRKYHGGEISGYVVDSGTHLLQTSELFPWTPSPIRNGTNIRERTLYGCLCMNSDVLRPGVLLPELAPGDPLVIHPVGAYHLTQSMPFIGYRPAVVMIHETGEAILIRQRDTLEHLEALERWSEF